MKRKIIVSNCESLTNEDYINFIEQCYKAWEIIPVKDIDLIIEYQDNFDLPMLLNTNNQWIWGIPNEKYKSFNEIREYVETVMDLQEEKYIIAHIRNERVKDYKIIKRVAH